MAVTVKKAVLWRRDIINQPGTFAASLKPFAESNIDLKVVMGYVIPGTARQAAIEVFPIASPKAEKAAKAAGLKAGNLHCLLVEGNNRAGLGYAIGNALSKASINMNFAVMQAIGRKYLGVFGFDSVTDAMRATPLIKEAAGSKGKASKKTIKKARAKVVIAATKKPAKAKKSAPKAPAHKPGSKKKATPKITKTSKRK